MCGVQLKTTAMYAAASSIYAASGACAARLLSNSALSMTAGALTGVAGGLMGTLVNTVVVKMMNVNATSTAVGEPPAYTKAQEISVVALHAFASFLASTALLHLAKVQMASKSIVIFSAMTSGIAIGVASVVVLLGMSVLLGLILSAFNR